MAAQGRITTHNWDLYDTRHAVFRPAKMTAEALETGYWRAYSNFYCWDSIFRAAWTKESMPERLRHLAYTGGWKKFEPLWDFVIRARRVASFLPLLEAVLEGVEQRGPQEDTALRRDVAPPNQRLGSNPKRMSA
jgi:hypothetical protein